MESNKIAQRAVKISAISVFILIVIALVLISISITQSNAIAQMSRKILELEQKIKIVESSKL